MKTLNLTIGLVALVGLVSGAVAAAVTPFGWAWAGLMVTTVFNGAVAGKRLAVALVGDESDE